MAGALALTAPVEVRAVIDGADLGTVARLAPAVGPPTVGQALAVLSADPARVRPALAAWLPPRFWSELRGLTDANVLYGAARLLAAFTPEREPVSSDNNGPAPEPDPEADVFDVALAIGQPASVVLAMPWPEYLATAEAAGRARADRLLDGATAARVAGTDGEGWRSFTETLDGGRRRKPDRARAERTPEQEAADAAEAAAWRAQMTRALEAKKAKAEG